jgi:hypothetical protein
MFGDMAVQSRQATEGPGNPGPVADAVAQVGPSHFCYVPCRTAVLEVNCHDPVDMRVNDCHWVQPHGQRPTKPRLLAMSGAASSRIDIEALSSTGPSSRS